MTDDELKALVASLAIVQKEASEQIKLTEAEMRLTFQQIRETQDRATAQLLLTEAQVRETSEQMKRTDAKLERTDEQLKRTDAKLERTDEQLKRTDAKLERIGITLGNIGQNLGDVAEEFFLNSLIKDPRLGSIHFDDVSWNMSKHRGQIQEQYDVVVTNGDAIGIVEVKYKAHESDLDKLDRKMRHFKQLFPHYQHYKQYGAIASFHINDKAKSEALSRGYFVLQRSGDLLHTESATALQVL